MDYQTYQAQNNVKVHTASKGEFIFKIVERIDCRKATCTTSFELITLRRIEPFDTSEHLTLTEAKETVQAFINYYEL